MKELDSDSTTSGTRINRRNVLRAATGTAVGLGFVSTASANNGNGKGPGQPDQYKEVNGIKYRFFGCSQVCVNKEYTKAAVVDEDGGCSAPSMRPRHSGRTSNRGNLWDDDDIYCLSTDDVDAEAIVGIYVYDGEWDERNRFIENPNNCANNYEDCDTYWGEDNEEERGFD